MPKSTAKNPARSAAQAEYQASLTPEQRRAKTATAVAAKRTVASPVRVAIGTVVLEERIGNLLQSEPNKSLLIRKLLEEYYSEENIRRRGENDKSFTRYAGPL